MVPARAQGPRDRGQSKPDKSRSPASVKAAQHGFSSPAFPKSPVSGTRFFGERNIQGAARPPRDPGAGSHAPRPAPPVPPHRAVCTSRPPDTSSTAAGEAGRASAGGAPGTRLSRPSCRLPTGDTAAAAADLQDGLTRGLPCRTPSGTLTRKPSRLRGRGEGVPGAGCTLRWDEAPGDLGSPVHVQATVPTPPGTARPLGQLRTGGLAAGHRTRQGRAPAVGEARLSTCKSWAFPSLGGGELWRSSQPQGPPEPKAPSKLRKPHVQTNNVAGGPQGTRPGLS